MFGLGPTELIVILLIVLLLFGGKKIPEIAKGLGKGIKEFKSAQNNKEVSDTEKDSLEKNNTQVEQAETHKNKS